MSFFDARDLHDDGQRRVGLVDIGGGKEVAGGDCLLFLRHDFLLFLHFERLRCRHLGLRVFRFRSIALADGDRARLVALGAREIDARGGAERIKRLLELEECIKTGRETKGP